MRFVNHLLVRWRSLTAGVRAYMVGLALLTTLPLTIFSVLIVGELRSGELESVRQRTTGEAEAIARLVDRQLHDMVTTLLVLETSPELRSRDFGRFHSRAKAALVRSGWYMLVVNRQGQQLLNTRVDYGEKLGLTGNLESIEESVKSGRPYISDVFKGRTSGRFVYNVMKMVDAPGVRDDELALILTQDAPLLGSLIGDRPLPPEWSYALIDGDNDIVTSPNGKDTGEPFPAELLEEAKTVSMTGEELPAADMMTGYSRVGVTPWQVVVWGPSNTAIGTVGTTWRYLILAGIGFFLLSIVSAMVFGRKLQSAIRLISERAEGVGRGEIVPPLYTGVTEIDQVSRVMSEASFDRNQAEERLQVVLREMAHRTKNVILVAQALVRQTARHTQDRDAFVKSITGRMGSFAHSLDLLTGNRASSPTFSKLITVQLDSFLEPGARLNTEGEDFDVDDDCVKEVGMLLHELATNAMKYGALSTPDGQLDLRWHGFRSEDGKEWIRITWQEAGGPPPKEPDEKGFGSVLIQSTVSSLHGTAQCEYLPEGICWTFEIPATMICAKPV